MEITMSDDEIQPEDNYMALRNLEYGCMGAEAHPCCNVYQRLNQCINLVVTERQQQCRRKFSHDHPQELVQSQWVHMSMVLMHLCWQS